MDHAAFTRYRIPPVRQAWGPREALLYAHSVLAGAFLDHPRALDYLSDTRGPAVLPGFAVDLGHPGFWLSDPATTADATRNLHAEESVELFGLLPPSGEVVGETRIVDVVDKGRDRGALVYLEKELRDTATGRLLALCRRTLMLRGDGGYDGPSGPARPTPAEPVTPPDRIRVLPTRPDQALFYRLNGDTNPLHLEPEVARRAGFDRPILQGLCTFGIAATAALFELAEGDAERFRSFSARFSAPVYPGETLRIEIWNDGALRVVAMERDRPVLTHGRAVIAG
ncbi:MAG: 3-alpha,7-alpha,12-alpha-trihydroxy-5-beta-cholest-24-enoyl-CoA hydratase [Paracoccus denitrificans]|uniref:3-alpha,7-alpha, 12-alpha-trihydroxy-5-beta-cholest-24-enoyl-CoA hydratase n=1 Tax=Paracoccus denitrificans TaxID=266 RepID=A0A533I182_PARDE|nr:MAG: 3-alpha,7-alpha,12-alpha-trihydroxy-5-beta-cholest-24-enoyl-CoA hydratase [Paracoccus denitrificans]